MRFRPRRTGSSEDFLVVRSQPRVPLRLHMSCFRLQFGSESNPVIFLDSMIKVGLP